MSTFAVRPLAALMAAMGSLAFAASAGAATLSVDDDGQDCPAAAYSSIQSAVDAAAPGDTIAVCAGDYAEGTGAVGTNALTITKSLTIKGAGADLVTISPKASGPAGGQIMEASPDLRNGIGDVVAVVGAPTAPLTVDISGVTVDGYAPGKKPVVVEAGIVYLDAKGSVVRSHVTNTVTSEGDLAYAQPGGYRGSQPGIGIVQTSASRLAQVDGVRTLDIELTRVDTYNKVGILIDGAQNDVPPLVASGAINRGELNGVQVVGRTQCVNYLGTGNCSVVGPVLNGPLFGQDGVRVTAGGRAQIFDSLISQNLVNGLGAPTRGDGTTTGNNPANLVLGAGIRLIGAKMTTGPVSAGLDRTFNTMVTRSSIVDNAYGALNYAADGVTANTGTTTAGGTNSTSNVFKADNNWWGVRIDSTVNTGPLVSPAINPPWPENPVGGVAAADPDVPTQTISNSVDFYPYRNGLQADGDNGQFPVLDAPIPVNDAAPTDVSLTSGAASVTRGSGTTLTASAQDDFGVKRVRFYDGATLLGTVTKPPYTQAITVPSDATCGSTRSYTAVVSDSIAQSTSTSMSIAVTCPASPPETGGPVAPPTVAFVAPPTKISSTRDLSLAVSAAAGVKSVQVRLGARVLCTITAAPFTCKVTPTGADVGTQSLTATVTDLAGGSATTTVKVTVPKFKATVRLKVTTKKVKGGKAKRTITGTLKRPAGVTRAQGCSGKVTVVIKKSGHAFLNQQVSVSKTCTFSRSVTASRKKQSFAVSARYGGNSVLSTTSTSRRFS